MKSGRDAYLHPWGQPARGEGMASAKMTTPLLPASPNCRAQDSNTHTDSSVVDEALGQ